MGTVHLYETHMCVNGKAAEAPVNTRGNGINICLFTCLHTCSTINLGIGINLMKMCTNTVWGTGSFYDNFSTQK